MGIASDGALTIRRSRVAGNSASSSGDGAQAGGIYQHRAGPVLIQDSTIEGNLARGATNAAGCGMYADGPFRMTIKGSTFSANAATATGGLSAFGGGLSNSATTTIENSTFVRNTARYGGGVAGDGALRLRASTVARNKALTRGGGLYVDGGSVSIGSTILAGNRTAGARKDCWIGGSVSVVDRGRTLLGSGTGCPQIAKGLRGNKVGSLAKPIDPRLGPLAANGGPTRTLGLLAGSPAINAAGKAPCTTRTDQRGVRRPQGGRCDIGAVERRGRAPF